MRAALEQEIERLHPASYAWALACCGYDPTEAEEALQTAYLKVFDGRARWDERSSVKTWLYAVIRRTAAARRRSRFLRGLLLARWWRAEERAPAPGPDEQAESEERRVRVRRALRALSPRQREVLELVFFHGLTVDEAAPVMGVAAGTARLHYDRGKRRLLEELGEP